MKIGNYQIEQIIIEKEDISFYVVSDSTNEQFLMRVVNESKNNEIITNSWFQCYEDFQLKITNYNYLPKPLSISTFSNMVYTLFPYEKGALLKDVKKLEVSQVEQLLEAVRHLHKKGFVHGNLHDETIFIRDNGDLLLFGTGERQLFSSAEQSLQLDYNQVLFIIREYTSFDVSILDGKQPNSLEEIQELLRTAEQVKPGLVEKESKTEHPKQRSVPEPVIQPKETEPKPVEQPILGKKKRPKWLIGIGSILLLFFIIGLLVDNDDSTQPVSTTKTEAEPIAEINKPPALSLEDFSALFPDWQPIKQEAVQLKDSYHTILAIGQKDSEDFGTLKIVVTSYDTETEQWKQVWESPEYEDVDPYFETEDFIGDMLVLPSEDQSKVVTVFNIMHSGNSGVYDTHVIEVNDKGIGNIAWDGYGTNIEEKPDNITVYNLGETHFSFKDNALNVVEIPRSEVGTSDAYQAGFTINDGFVEPTETRDIQLEVGQTLTFVPMSDEAKWNFDEGNISVYTNLWNVGSPVNLSHSNLLYGGNNIEFTEEGIFEFVLDYYNGTTSFDDPPPTFIVYVGDVEIPSQETVGEATPGVTTPFGLGAPLSQLIDHYGEPSYDDYFLGGRLVVFGQDGYFLDEFEDVGGFYIANTSVSVFGANVGMTGDEINAVYGEQVEPYFDSSETSEYVFTYYIDQFKIFFHADEPDGPTTSVLVLVNSD